MDAGCFVPLAPLPIISFKKGKSTGLLPPNTSKSSIVKNNFSFFLETEWSEWNRAYILTLCILVSWSMGGFCRQVGGTIPRWRRCSRWGTAKANLPRRRWWYDQALGMIRDFQKSVTGDPMDMQKWMFKSRFYVVLLRLLDVFFFGDDW